MEPYEFVRERLIRSKAIWFAVFGIFLMGAGMTFLLNYPIISIALKTILCLASLYCLLTFAILTVGFKPLIKFTIYKYSPEEIEFVNKIESIWNQKNKTNGEIWQELYVFSREIELKKTILSPFVKKVAAKFTEHAKNNSILKENAIN